MEKRTFLKLSSSLIAASPLLSSFDVFQYQEKLKNWAGNLEYSTNNVHAPASIDEIRALVGKTDKARVLGSRHCFNDIADSRYNLISTEKLNKLVSLDKAAKTVTVEGGMKYGDLSPLLEAEGFALHNLASLPHISIAGACTTATHGSGVKNGNLATSVRAIELVTADGSVINLSADKDRDRFAGAVVSLGAIGVITKVTLSTQPTFRMKQYVFEKVPLSEVKANFEKIVYAGYSVSLFTDWSEESINEVWVKMLSDDDRDSAYKKEFFRGVAATRNVHPIIELSAENCTEQLGVEGNWYERLPHFKMGFTPSSGKELQAEYFVSRANAVDAILAIQKMGKEITPHLFISEIRTIAADDLWLSPCYKQDSVAIHFTWKQDWPSVSKLLPKIEKELAPFKVRPHWGKLFTVNSKTLAERYEKMDEFRKLMTELDPKRKFRNDFLEKTIPA